MKGKRNGRRTGQGKEWRSKRGEREKFVPVVEIN